MKHLPFTSLVPLVCLSLAAASCSSDALEGSPGGMGGGAGAGTDAPRCQAALRQALVPVDAVSPGVVSTLQRTGPQAHLYLDASTGGLGGKDAHPWLYLSLASGTRVDLTDEEAMQSSAWDLAFERSSIRTNSGDSGPGRGGAAFVTQSFEMLAGTVAEQTTLAEEDWFDDDCTLGTDAVGDIVTTFSGWSQYDEATHVLLPVMGTYVVRGGDGSLYKLAIVDYYANPDGSHGTRAGRYRLRVAAFEE